MVTAFTLGPVQARSSRDIEEEEVVERSAKPRARTLVYDNMMLLMLEVLGLYGSTLL